MVGVLACWAGKYVRFEGGRIGLQPGNGNLTYLILSIGFLAQYLPWVLVPRSMYIYHYFASVPFIIMATAVLIEKCTRGNTLLRKLIIILYISGAVVFFIMLFPYASGYLTNVEWLDAMKWVSGLYY